MAPLTRTTLSSIPRPVYDRLHRPLGTVDTDEALDPNDPHGTLHVELSSDARAILRTDRETIRVPITMISAIRRDEIRLSATFERLDPALFGTGSPPLSRTRM